MFRKEEKSPRREYSFVINLVYAGYEQIYLTQILLRQKRNSLPPPTGSARKFTPPPKKINKNEN